MSFYDPDLVKRAQGSDVYTDKETEELQKKAAAATNRRIAFFNTEDGWKLRRVARGHQIVRLEKAQYCTLCGGHKPGALRVQTDVKCATCDVPLCAKPRKDSPLFSCHHDWHHTDYLEPRFIPRTNKRSAGSSSADSGKRSKRAKPNARAEEEEKNPACP